MCFTIQIEAQDENKIMEAIMGSKKVDASKLPEAYQFEWEFKTVLKTANNKDLDMSYLINPDSDYFGMQMSSKEYQQMDFMCIVMDIKAELIATFMIGSGQKMVMLSPTPKERTKKTKDPEYSYKEIGSKEILGYESYGIELENADYIGTIYFTLDAPVSFSALFAYSKDKNTPKGFDPALLEVLEEEALVMEMNFTHKKKKKQNFTMTAVSLEKNQIEIKPKDYRMMRY